MSHSHKKARLLTDVMMHRHPLEPSGTLLRINAKVDSLFVDDTPPIPNDVCVIVSKKSEGFSLVTFETVEGEKVEGWIRTSYLSFIQLTIVTYNILTGLPMYEKETTGEKFSAWENRKQKVLQAVFGHDIIMLNEATLQQLQYLQTNLNIGANKTHFMLKPQNNDGSAILIKNKVWTIVESLSCAIRPGYPQVVVAVKLEHTTYKKPLFVVSLHLKSGYDEMEKRRCEEFQCAMRHVYGKWPEAEYGHLVVAGDLNSDYANTDYARLVDFVCVKYNLTNAAGHPNGHGEKTPTYYYHHKSVFDYILYRNSLFSLKSMKTEVALHKAPNATQGSDHFPVSATLQLV